MATSLRGVNTCQGTCFRQTGCRCNDDDGVMDAYWSAVNLQSCAHCINNDDETRSCDETTCPQFIPHPPCTCPGGPSDCGDLNGGYGPIRPNPDCPQGCMLKVCPNVDNHCPAWDTDANPEWLYDCHGGHCSSCAVLFGHGFSHTGQIEECPVCL